MGGMKRSREESNMTSMAKCLMFLSSGGQTESRSRLFECKTCSREFPSFQALGGHRASHKKSRTKGDEEVDNKMTEVKKTKIHECSICGLEFAIGQALGGHMRRHRNTNSQDSGHSSESMQGRRVMKYSSSKRILCIDLNLTPFENDLKQQLASLLPNHAAPPLLI